MKNSEIKKQFEVWIKDLDTKTLETGYIVCFILKPSPENGILFLKLINKWRYTLQESRYR